MSLGNTYNNNQGMNRNNPNDTFSVYSSYRMNNADSDVDASCLTFRFWKTNLCIGIFPRKNTGNDEVQFDMDNGITIYLSHTKAAILKNELELFLKDPITYNESGVNSGQSTITISNGVSYGKNNPLLIIRKLGEGGTIVSSFAYEFHHDYHFSIRNYDETTLKATSVYDEYNDLEIRQLITLLDEYCKAMTKAVAFTVLDERKYSANRTESKIDAIAKELGVDISRGGNNSEKKFNSNSYFGNNSRSDSGYSGVSYATGSIDDLD